jgi:hypothetical protein
MDIPAAQRRTHIHTNDKTHTTHTPAHTIMYTQMNLPGIIVFIGVIYIGRVSLIQCQQINKIKNIMTTAISLGASM